MQLTPNPMKYKNDGYYQLPDSIKPGFYPFLNCKFVYFFNTRLIQTVIQ